MVGAVLAALEIDLAVLTEYHRVPGDRDLSVVLARTGWPNIVHGDPPQYSKSVLIASGVPVELIGVRGHPLAPHRSLHVRVDDMFDLLGVYRQPTQPKRSPAGETERVEVNDVLVQLAAELANADAMLLGDLNTGQPALDCVQGQFKAGNPYERIVAAGWVDAVRYLHPDELRFSHWTSRRDGGFNGFRLDHAFVTPGLVAKLGLADYVTYVDSIQLVRSPDSPTVGQAISDHAALALEMT